MIIKLKKKKTNENIPFKSFEHPVDFGQTFLFTNKKKDTECIHVFSDHKIDGRSKLFVRRCTHIYTLMLESFRSKYYIHVYVYFHYIIFIKYWKQWFIW